eukprot:scaffold219173_cov49-Attheya_sp.AAC.2
MSLYLYLGYRIARSLAVVMRLAGMKLSSDNMRDIEYVTASNYTVIHHYVRDMAAPSILSTILLLRVFPKRDGTRTSSFYLGSSRSRPNYVPARAKPRG